MDHKDAIKRYHQRRAARLGFRTIEHYDSIEQYRRRRAERMSARMDADSDDETASAGGAKKGGHGNTKIPFGLCQREGIEIQKGWTPEDAWKALEGKGYSAGDTYKKLKATGKVSGSGQKKAEAPKQKDFASMDYDALYKEYEDHNRRYQEAEERYRNKDKTIKSINGMANRVKKMKERGDYHGETYEELKKNELPEDGWSSLEDDEFQKQYTQHMMIRAMDNLGHDIFEKSADEIDRIVEKKVDEVSSISFGELNAEREKIQKAMAVKAKEKYPKLSDCDSPSALEMRMRADEFFNVGERDSAVMDFNGIDPATVSGIGKGLETIKEKFPQLQGALRPVQINDEVDSNAYAHCETHSMMDAHVVLNKNKFKDFPKMQENMKRDVKSGFHPKGTGTVESVVLHEYGHAIDDYLSKQYEKELGGKKFYQYVLDTVRKNHPGMGAGEILASVSRYSMNNNQKPGVEWLAEAFSEYCCSKKPRPIAAEIGKIMTDFISNPSSATAKPVDDEGEEIPLF